MPMTLMQFLLMALPMAAVCVMVNVGAGRFGRWARWVRVLALGTLALWFLVPFEQWFSGAGYNLFIVAMILFQSGMVATGVLSLFVEPPWPRPLIIFVRIVGVVLAVLWGVSLLFGFGVLLSQ